MTKVKKIVVTFSEPIHEDEAEQMAEKLQQDFDVSDYDGTTVETVKE